MNEYLDLIKNLFSRNKKLYYIFLIPLFILLYVFYSSFINKATITVKTTGPEGQVKVFVRSLGSEPKEVVKEGREVNLRLNGDNYKVTSVIYNIDQDGEFQELSSSKNVELKSRSKQTIDLNIAALPSVSSTDISDPVASISTSGEDLYISTVFGVTTIYKLSDNSATKIRKEPAYLSRVAGICPFSNGNSVAIDTNGQYYSIKGTQASVIDMAGGLSLEQLSFLENKPTGFINGTKNLVCTPEKATFYGTIEISSSFSKNFVPRNEKNLQRLNYKRDSNNNLWLYDSVSKDSFDHDSTSNSYNKDLIKVSPDGLETRIDNRGYITAIAINSKGEVCTFYKNTISCADNGQNTSEQIYSLPDNQEITNIALDEDGNVFYSSGGSVWSFNKASAQSTQIFSSKLKITPKVMDLNTKLKKLSFVTEKTSNADKEYKLRVVSL